MILSLEYRNKFLDLFRGYKIDPIEKFWIGLINENGDEINFPSYQRIEYDASPIAWFSTQYTVDEPSNGSSNKITNVASISWGTALESWGTINKIRFYTQSTGSSYFCDHKVESLNITSGDEVDIDIENFSIEISNDN